MTLPVPDLDDRTFDQLVAEALAKIRQACPSWTDHSVHDPGIALVEAFAYLTETTIFRLNRLPAKAFVAFLNLMDARLQPPSAAVTELVFRLPRAAASAVHIPRGTRVATNRPGPAGEIITFVTDESVVIEAGQTSVSVTAHHCDLVDAELLGEGTGLPGLTLQVKRPPIVSTPDRRSDLVVGVECEASETPERARSRTLAGRVYRIWREVDSFVPHGMEPHVYVADRAAGLIRFGPAAQVLSDTTGAESLLDAPASLAAMVPKHREIRAWYRSGGGDVGNVAPGMLTVLKDPIPGAALSVTNPSPAVGGRDVESIANALIRGPAELHSLRRAVTAGDFEGLALRAGGVARAKAFTRRAMWEHAAPGTVDIALVPYVPEDATGNHHEHLRHDVLGRYAQEAERRSVLALLDQRRPLGTNCEARWARYKPVRVKAELVLHAGEDAQAVCRRVEQRLYAAISPLVRNGSGLGGGFGEPLVKGRIYDSLLAERGIRYVSKVTIEVEHAPERILALVADRFQPETWYAGTGAGLFRSINDGVGWEQIGPFSSDAVAFAAVHWSAPGWLAIATRSGDEDTFRLFVSHDCGETWLERSHAIDAVTGLSWISRDKIPTLLVATRNGLFALNGNMESTPRQVLVARNKPNLGFSAIISGPGTRGMDIVAIAAESASEGVFLSTDGGSEQSFRDVGLIEDVASLAIQTIGPTTYLWAGLAAAGDGEGTGCRRMEVTAELSSANAWQPVATGFTGGSVRALAVCGASVYAGSHRRGVLNVDAGRDKTTWSAPGIRVGLPLREVTGRVFSPIVAVAVGKPRQNKRGDAQPTLIVGTQEGIFRLTRPLLPFVPTESWNDASYVKTSDPSADIITVPRDWLLCSAEHEVTVSEHEGD